MNKIIFIMATMASLAIGAELEHWYDDISFDNIVGLLGASTGRGYHDKKEETSSKEEIPGYDTIPISM